MEPIEKRRVFRPALAILIGVPLAVVAGAVILVAVAFGLGRLLSGFLALSVFEATLLALLAIVAVGAALWRGVENLVRPRLWEPRWVEGSDHACEEEDGDNWNEDDDTAEPGRVVGPAAVSPQPQASRNAPCPCGSGKKYKKCCGAERAGAA